MSGLDRKLTKDGANPGNNEGYSAREIRDFATHQPSYHTQQRSSEIEREFERAASGPFVKGPSEGPFTTPMSQAPESSDRRWQKLLEKTQRPKKTQRLEKAAETERLMREFLSHETFESMEMPDHGKEFMEGIPKDVLVKLRDHFSKTSKKSEPSQEKMALKKKVRNICNKILLFRNLIKHGPMRSKLENEFRAAGETLGEEEVISSAYELIQTLNSLGINESEKDDSMYYLRNKINEFYETIHRYPQQA